MKTIALTLAAFVLMGLNARAEDKADKLLGKWEAVKGQLPPGSTVEFSKGGKIKVVVKAEGKTETHDGTYTFEGGTIKVTRKHDGEVRTQSYKVKTLNEKELVVEGERGTSEFKRVKK
jgi:uncharacterized protein (TIGR03066 family)